MSNPIDFDLELLKKINLNKNHLDKHKQIIIEN